MKSTIRNRYIKGIFALGLALTLSNNCFPASEKEEQRQEEKVLSFNIEETDHKKMAITSARKINAHIDHAIYLANSSTSELLGHMQATREIVNALQILMPHMQLIDMLSVMQNELSRGEYYKFHNDVIKFNRKLNDIQSYMPKFAANLKDGLQTIEYLVKENEEPTTINRQFSLFYAELAKQVAYIPINYLENNLKKIEKILNNKTPQQQKLLTVLEESKQYLQLCNDYQQTIMLS